MLFSFVNKLFSLFYRHHCKCHETDNGSCVQQIRPGKHVTRSFVSSCLSEDGYVKMFLRGRPITMYIPSGLRASYTLDIKQELPEQKLRLDWVYPHLLQFTLWGRALWQVLLWWFIRLSPVLRHRICIGQVGTEDGWMDLYYTVCVTIPSFSILD